MVIMIMILKFKMIKACPHAPRIPPLGIVSWLVTLIIVILITISVISDKDYRDTDHP